MRNDLKGMPFQIDFKTNQTPKGEVQDYIRNNSTKVQHLLDSEPRFSRWWFDGLSTAAKAIQILEDNDLDVDYRLVAANIDAVFIQKGEF